MPVKIYKIINSLFLSSLATCLFLVLATTKSFAADTGCTYTSSPLSCTGNGDITCAFDGKGTLDANCKVMKNAFETTLCNLLNLVTGTGGKAFAAFAIISVGIGFFTGKVSWGLMIGVAAGIAAIFGAPTIVQALAGGSKLDADSCKGTVDDL